MISLKQYLNETYSQKLKLKRNIKRLMRKSGLKKDEMTDERVDAISTFINDMKSTQVIT